MKHATLMQLQSIKIAKGMGPGDYAANPLAQAVRPSHMHANKHRHAASPPLMPHHHYPSDALVGSRDDMFIPPIYHGLSASEQARRERLHHPAFPFPAHAQHALANKSRSFSFDHELAARKNMAFDGGTGAFAFNTAAMLYAQHQHAQHSLEEAGGRSAPGVGLDPSKRSSLDLSIRNPYSHASVPVAPTYSAGAAGGSCPISPKRAALHLPSPAQTHLHGRFDGDAQTMLAQDELRHKQYVEAYHRRHGDAMQARFPGAIPDIRFMGPSAVQAPFLQSAYGVPSHNAHFAALNFHNQLFPAPATSQHHDAHRRSHLPGKSEAEAALQRSAASSRYPSMTSHSPSEHYKHLQPSQASASASSMSSVSDSPPRAQPHTSHDASVSVPRRPHSSDASSDDVDVENVASGGETTAPTPPGSAGSDISVSAGAPGAGAAVSVSRPNSQHSRSPHATSMTSSRDSCDAPTPGSVRAASAHSHLDLNPSSAQTHSSNMSTPPASTREPSPEAPSPNSDDSVIETQAQPSASLLLSELTKKPELPSAASTAEAVKEAFKFLEPILKRVSIASR